MYKAWCLNLIRSNGLLIGNRELFPVGTGRETNLDSIFSIVSKTSPPCVWILHCFIPPPWHYQNAITIFFKPRRVFFPFLFWRGMGMVSDICHSSILCEKCSRQMASQTLLRNVNLCSVIHTSVKRQTFVL